MSPTSSASSTAAIIGAVVAVVSVAIAVIVLLLVFRRRRSRTKDIAISLRLASSFTSKGCKMSLTHSLHDTFATELIDLEMPRENITVLDELGQGEFGVVMSASAVNLPNTAGSIVFGALKLL